MDTMTKRETLTAGDILHCGWGSDMSINDYYEVTRVTPSGKTAYLRLSSFEFAFPMDMAEAAYGCHEDHND